MSDERDRVEGEGEDIRYGTKGDEESADDMQIFFVPLTR